MPLIHTCYRITNIARSLEFYEALGFEERGRSELPDGATNIFIGMSGDGSRLELTFNPGVESYEVGTGYGHIAILSDDLDATLARLREHGISPEKPPYSLYPGDTRLCFIRDPDSYRIEICEEDPYPG